MTEITETSINKKLGRPVNYTPEERLEHDREYLKKYLKKKREDPEYVKKANTYQLSYYHKRKSENPEYKKKPSENTNECNILELLSKN